MNTLLYTAEHEWLQTQDAQTAVVGITVHAQDALGDVVYVELPTVGQHYAQGAVAGVVESVKAAADLYMPVSGEVTKVNDALRDNPALANTDPLQTGWFFEIKFSQPDELQKLMDESAYTQLLKTL